MISDIVIQDINEVYVKVNCEPNLAHELRDHFTFMVPGAQFSPRFRARLWDGKIRLLDTRTNHIYRGLVPNIIDFCNTRNYTYSYTSFDDEFSLKEAEQFISKLNPKHVPRDYQIESFVDSIRTRRQILLSPTSSGKSLIIYLLVHYLLQEKNSRGLIVVPTVSLVKQLFSDFIDYSENNAWDVENNVQVIFEGMSKTISCPVTISTWQSLQNMSPKFFKQFTYVIGDEAHQFKAKSLISIMTNLTNAKYRIGTTGTLDGLKTNKLVLEGLFGPVKQVITTKELMDRKDVADFSIKCLVLKYDDQTCKAARDFNYQKEIEFLVLNDRRNKFISNLALSLKGNTLILYQYVDKHGKILFDMINNEIDHSRKSYFIHGNVDADMRERTRKEVENETDSIIVASYGTFSTGINIRNLHNIIFASPSKSRIRNLQSIGRGLRKSDTKTNAVLFDISDDLVYKRHENYTIKHFYERIKIYSEEKFKFKVYKIELKGK